MSHPTIVTGLAHSSGIFRSLESRHVGTIDVVGMCKIRIAKRMLVEINCSLCRCVMQIVGTPGKKRKQPFRFDGTLTDNERLAYLDRAVASRDLSTTRIFSVRVNIPFSYPCLPRSIYIKNISLSINNKYKLRDKSNKFARNIERNNICVL